MACCGGLANRAEGRVNNPPQVDNLPYKSFDDDVHNSPAVSGKPSIRFMFCTVSPRLCRAGWHAAAAWQTEPRGGLTTRRRLTTCPTRALMTMFTIAPQSRESPASDSCFAPFHHDFVGQDGMLRRLGKPSRGAG